MKRWRGGTFGFETRLVAGGFALVAVAMGVISWGLNWNLGDVRMEMDWEAIFKSAI